MQKPIFKELVLTGTGVASTRTQFDIQSIDDPFMPFAFAHYSTGRYLAELLLSNEPLQNAAGDGDAMFGKQGDLVRIPRAALKILPAEKEFKLFVTDLTAAPNVVTLAILGLQFVGMRNQDIPKQPEGWIKWINLYKSVTASSVGFGTGKIDFPFILTHMGFKATGRATLDLSADRVPFFSQAGDIDALLGTTGKMIAVPPEGRLKYPAGRFFEAKYTDLSASTNVITTSLFGIEVK